MAKETLPPNIRPYGDGGYLAIAKVVIDGKVRRKEKTFTAGESMRDVILKWQRDTCVALAKAEAPKAGSLIDELPTYIRRRTSRGMRTIGQREVALRRMFAILGPNKSRAEVTAGEIEDMLITLKAQGCHKGVTPCGRRKAGGRTARALSNATINRNRNALQNFFTVMGGKSAANPVKDVAEYPEPKRQKPARITFELLDRILDAMPDLGRIEKGQKRSETSLTKIRLRVIAFAGLPQQQIRELTPDDIDWDQRLVFVGRNKGQGLDGEWREMGDYGMAALREFADARAFGEFSSSSMYKSFCLARDQVEPGSTVTPYKLRHLFSTFALDASGDEKASSRLALHASEATSSIYRESAERRRDRAAWNAIDKAHRKAGRVLPGAFGAKSGRKQLEKRVG